VAPHDGVMQPEAEGPPIAVPGLGVAAAARKLGIAPATLRTWDRRYGIGPTGHTPGRHRRYSADDIARLELMQHALVRGATSADAAGYALTARLPARDTAGSTEAVPPAEAAALLPPGTGGRVRTLRMRGAGRAALGLGHAALALDTAAVRALLTETIATSGVVVAWDDVARPVLAAVAERWAFTGAGVEIEHLLSDCMVGVFSAATATAPPAADTRPVLLAGMPGEQHLLPMVVLAAALAQRRVPSRSLGADLPTTALVSAVRRTAPLAVVLWSLLPDTADPVVPGSLPRTRPRVRSFVAGPGWADVELSPRLVRLTSLTGALDALATVASA
jgi:MerR family transcriptional regulator, light-induced transcriptional regulator